MAKNSRSLPIPSRVVGHRLVLHRTSLGAVASFCAALLLTTMAHGRTMTSCERNLFGIEGLSPFTMPLHQIPLIPMDNAASSSKDRRKYVPSTPIDAFLPSMDRIAGKLHAVSPNTSSIAVSPDGISIRLIDLATGKVLLNKTPPFEAPTSETPRIIEAIRFSEDGQRLVVGTKLGQVAVYTLKGDLVYKLQTRHMTNERSRPYLVAMDTARNMVTATTSDGHTDQWDLYTGQLLSPLEPLTQPPADHARLSPDGTRLAAIRARFGAITAEITDLRNGDAHVVDAFVNGVPNRQAELIRAFEFSSDGKQLAALRMDKSITIYDMDSLAEVHTLKHLNVRSFKISPDGRKLMTASTDGYLKVWDLTFGRMLYVSQTPGAVASLAFSPDSSHASILMRDGSLYVWSMVRARFEQRVGDESTEFVATEFLDNERILTVTEKGQVVTWTLR